MVKDSPALPTVLLVEDDDVALGALVFRRAKLPCQFQTVRTIEMAREYLCGWGMYGDRAQFPVPCLIITDLGFASPGEEFLQWLRESRYKSIPVACLTGLDDPNVDDARKFVNACIQKFLTVEDLVAFIRQILGTSD